MLKKFPIEYNDNNYLLEGTVVYQEKGLPKKPLILIAHDWSGKNAFAIKKAERLAELGYIGFALDMYGKGKIGTTKEEKSALMKPLTENRALLLSRMVAAYKAAKELAITDNHQIAAIGFCFGGMCALDLARSGCDLKGVISFHGLLNPPPNPKEVVIKAKVLALHGFNDPMVTPDQVLQFSTEMNDKKVDWQLMLYGQTYHAFTNPEANDPAFGTVYHPLADKRAERLMIDFFKEIFII